MKKSSLWIGFIISLSLFACSSNKEQGQQHSAESMANADSSIEYTTFYEDERLIIQDAWTRVAPENGMTAGFMRLQWKSAESDSLLSFYTEVCKRHEIHETYEREEGMMGMRQIPGLLLQQDEVAELKPGGKHLMLMGLNKDLVAGDSINVALTFSTHETVSLRIPVRALVN